MKTMESDGTRIPRTDLIKGSKPIVPDYVSSVPDIEAESVRLEAIVDESVKRRHSRLAHTNCT